MDDSEQLMESVSSQQSIDSGQPLPTSPLHVINRFQEPTTNFCDLKGSLQPQLLLPSNQQQQLLSPGNQHRQLLSNQHEQQLPSNDLQQQLSSTQQKQLLSPSNQSPQLLSSQLHQQLPLLSNRQQQQQVPSSPQQLPSNTLQHNLPLLSDQAQQPQLPSDQLQEQQLNELAVSSSELVHSHQDTALDGVALPHSYLEDLCPVCNDRVSGYHYGLQTCESCKGNTIVLTHI